MPAPINYGIQVADPFASALQGLRLGATIQEMQAAQQKSAAQQALLQQQAETQGNFNRKAQQILQGGLSNATAEDFAELSMFTDKDTAATLQNTFSSLSKDKQNQTLSSVSEVVSALSNGRPDIAAERLRSRASVLRESNLPENVREANLLEAQADLADKDPEFLEFDLKYKLATLPGGKDYLTNVEQTLKTRREEALAPAAQKEAKAKAEKAKKEVLKVTEEVGLTKEQTKKIIAETKKLGVETSKIRAEIEAAKSGGVLPLEKRFDFETKLRGEYNKYSGPLNELNSTYSNLKASAAAKNGPGDIALITQFMKMLDPGSVVRETEFATARDTEGLFNSLKNQAEKLQSGQLFALDSPVRQQYVTLAKEYLKAAEKQAQQKKEDLTGVANEYKLNPSNIFGRERAPRSAEQEAPTGPFTATAPNGAVYTFPTAEAASQAQAAFNRQPR